MRFSNCLALIGFEEEDGDDADDDVMVTSSFDLLDRGLLESGNGPFNADSNSSSVSQQLEITRRI